MEAKHTPGPWREGAAAVPIERGSPFKIIDDNYRNIHAGEGRFSVGDPRVGFWLSGFISPENARLIAAAPELLEALEKIRNLERRNFREAWDMLQEVDRLAGAAIRKAKGE